MMNDLDDLKLSMVEVKTEMKVAFKILNELKNTAEEIKDNHLFHMNTAIQELQTKMRIIGALSIGSVGIIATLLGVILTKIWK